MGVSLPGLVGYQELLPAGSETDRRGRREGRVCVFTGVGTRLDQPQENKKRYQKERSGRRMRDLGEAGWCDSPKD